MWVVSLSSLPVGVLLWNSPEPSLTVIAKMTLSFGPAGFELAAVQSPLRGPAASAFACPLELWHPGDFVPRKVGCDVLLSGNAYADAPSLVIGANVRIGAIKKRFYALASERSVAIPLSLAYLREQPSADSPEVTVGALSREHPERERFRGVEAVRPSELRRLTFPARFDFSYFNAAPEDQQIEAISPGMAVMLHGLSPGGAVHGKLPSKLPRVFFPDERAGHALREIALRCDTMWFDTDRATCELVFRGTLTLARRSSLPSRLLVLLAEANEALDPARIEARAAFARPERAVTPEDVESVAEVPFQAPEPEPEPEELEPEPEPAPEPSKADTIPPLAGVSSGDPDRTVLHTGLPLQRAQTMPFARTPAGAGSPEQTLVRRDSRPPPPASGLPFLSTQRPTMTLNLPADRNPALAALPFDDKPLLRPRTVDVAKEAVAHAPAPPRFGLPDETLVPPPGTQPPPPLIPAAPPVPVALDPATLGTPWTTLGPPGTTAPPWAAALAPADAVAKPLETKPIEKLGLFTLEQDAEIQLALWESDAPLHETLAKHGTDELTWREHRRLRDAALREEAESGGSARALAVHEALEAARTRRAGEEAPSLDLDAYAKVRAAIRDAEDEPAALSARGIDLARWQQDHRYYRKRLLKDPAFAERFRAALSVETAAEMASPKGPPGPSGFPHTASPRVKKSRRKRGADRRRESNRHAR